MSPHASLLRPLLGPRADDIFIVGHPKSGNTWVAFLLALAQYPDRWDDLNLRNVGHFVPTVHGMTHPPVRYFARTRPRLFRDEWPVAPERYAKTIYVVRDPRDALVSYYHHYIAVTGDADRTIGGFIDEYLAEGCIPSFEPNLERWDRQVVRWLAVAERRAVFLLRYEDLIADRRRGLGALLAFTGLRLRSGTDRDAIVERTSFSAMQNLELRAGAESYVGARDASARFVRRGEVGSWQSELPAAQAEAIKEAFGPTMAKLGYEV